MATEKRLIDANALLETLCDCCSLQQQEMCKTDPVCATALVVAEFPTVDAVEVVHGRWISTEEKEHLMYKCSHCGDMWSYGAMLHCNYCPNCGADMRDGDGNE